MVILLIVIIIVIIIMIIMIFIMIRNITTTGLPKPDCDYIDIDDDGDFNDCYYCDHHHDFHINRSTQAWL